MYNLRNWRTASRAQIRFRWNGHYGAIREQLKGSGRGKHRSGRRRVEQGGGRGIGVHTEPLATANRRQTHHRRSNICRSKCANGSRVLFHAATMCKFNLPKNLENKCTVVVLGCARALPPRRGGGGRGGGRGFRPRSKMIYSLSLLLPRFSNFVRVNTHRCRIYIFPVAINWLNIAISDRGYVLETG